MCNAQQEFKAAPAKRLRLLLLLLLLFVLLAGIFTQLFYMLRDSKKSEKTKTETKAVQKNCWRLGLKDIESEGTRHGVERSEVKWSGSHEWLQKEATPWQPWHR